MYIEDILRHKTGEVVTIGADRTVHEAVCALNEHRIGALIVTDESGVCGIITERDILRECGERCTHLVKLRKRAHTPCPTLVKNLMTTDLIIGVPDDDLNYVMGVMTKNRVRHLPVLDDGELVGIISIGDVVKALVDESAFELQMLKGYIQGAAV
jgi:CBS domain-containing protein